MKNRRKLILFSIIILSIIITILLVFIFNLRNKKNVLNENYNNNQTIYEEDVSDEYVDSIEYDVYIQKVIYKIDCLYTPITTAEYRLINLNERKLYIIKSTSANTDYKKEHKEFKESTSCEIKNLTDVQVEKIKTLYDNSKLTYTENSSNCFLVKVNNNRMELKELPFEDDLW